MMKLTEHYFSDYVNRVGGFRGADTSWEAARHLNVKGTTVEVEIDGQDQKSLWRKILSRFHDRVNVCF